MDHIFIHARNICVEVFSGTQKGDFNSRAYGLCLTICVCHAGTRIVKEVTNTTGRWQQHMTFRSTNASLGNFKSHRVRIQ